MNRTLSTCRKPGFALGINGVYPHSPRRLSSRQSDIWVIYGRQGSRLHFILSVSAGQIITSCRESVVSRPLLDLSFLIGSFARFTSCFCGNSLRTSLLNGPVRRRRFTDSSSQLGREIVARVTRGSRYIDYRPPPVAEISIWASACGTLA